MDEFFASGSSLRRTVPPRGLMLPRALHRFSLASDRRVVQKKALPKASLMTLVALPALGAQLRGLTAAPPGAGGGGGSGGALQAESIGSWFLKGCWAWPPTSWEELVPGRPGADLSGSAEATLSSSPVATRAPVLPGPAVEVVGYQDG